MVRVRKKNAVWLLRVLPFLVWISAAAAFAGYASKIIIHNNISAGIVDIRLEELMENENGEYSDYADDKVVVPAQKISKIPRITCLEASCYVRAKAYWNTEGNKKGQEIFSISEDDFGGIGRGWVKAGDYYYYTRALKKGGYIDFFRSIKFPDSYTEGTAGQKLTVWVEVDAIQSAHFMPDFDSDDPWHGATIIKSIKSRDGEVRESISVSNMEITFEGNAKKLISNTDNCFEAFGELMPGDTKKGSLKVWNTTKEEQDIRLRISVPEQDKKAIDLLSEIDLCIKNDGETIFESTAADGLEDDIYLGRYEPGGKSRLTFELHMRETVNNRLALSEGKTAWMFLAEEADPDTEPTGVLSDTQQKGEQSTVVPVKTGDELEAEAYVVSALLSMLTAIVIFLSCRRKKHGST